MAKIRGTKMAKYSKTEIAQARAKLRQWLKPGMTVYTVLDHVSRSGMSRVIRVVLIEGRDNGEHAMAHPNYSVGAVLGYSQAKKGDGLIVGGCGMDMGFHVVHSLGYALWGHEASEGVGKEANALRKAIGEVTKSYLTQGGAPMPDYRKPDRVWFGAAGYALKHRWI